MANTQKGKVKLDKGSFQLPTYGGKARHMKLGQIGRSIVEALPVGIVVFNNRLQITEANYRASELIDLGEFIDESLSKGTQKTAQMATTWTNQLKKLIREEQTHSFDSVTYVSGDKTKSLRIVFTPIKKAHGRKTSGGIIILEDITEQVYTQRELSGAERLATIGKLASKVAHDLNDPLDGILRYINLATRIVEQERLEKPREYLGRCREGLTRMIQIVSELLEFARGTYTLTEYINVEQIIEDAIRAMETKVEASKIRMLRNYLPGTLKIKSDNIFQVFCNLIKNAFDAMPEGGDLHISTYLAPDNMVVIQFRDTGSGFAPEHADTIFEPFFTTKESQKGTGLGLAICKDIVEKHNGRITAENASEGGSIFTVYLPLLERL